MGRFASVVDAEMNSRGNYLPWLNGKLRVKIDLCKFLTTKEGKPAFIVNFEVLKVLVKPEKLEDDEGNKFPVVGEARDWYCSLAPVRGGGVPGASDMKAFTVEACPEAAELVEKIDHGDYSKSELAKLNEELEELYEAIVDESEDGNILADTELNVATVAAKTKSGNPFTRHTWAGV